LTNDVKKFSRQESNVDSKLKRRKNIRVIPKSTNRAAFSIKFYCKLLMEFMSKVRWWGKPSPSGHEIAICHIIFFFQKQKPCQIKAPCVYAICTL